MKPILGFTAFVLLTGVLVDLSCKKEYSCEGCSDKNKPPIALAGPDQTITLPTDSVSLDGSSSSDPDGTISSFQWTKISGPASFTIRNASVARTLVKNFAAGAYQFELKVTDNGGLSAKDTMNVIVKDPSQPNRAPVANAGPDQSISLPLNSINLDGSGSTDPDNNIISYTWTKISGPSSFSIANVNTVQIQVTSLVQGAYQFELKVTDAGMLLSKDTVQVTVSITQPDPCAGPASRPLINAQLIPFGTLSGGACARMLIASAGNKIVFTGGEYDGAGNSLTGWSSTRVDIYDIITHSWSAANLSAARFHMGVAVSGNKIFFAGGEDFNDLWYQAEYANVDIYDASTNSWSVDSLSGHRIYPVGAAVGDNVIFAGGIESYTPSLLNIADIYNLTTNSWSGATLSEARFYISAVTANNKICFAGGVNNNSNSSSSVTNRIDIYDNATSSWSTSTLIEPKGGMAGIAFAGKIYWAGGWTNTNNGTLGNPSSQVEIKDVSTQTSAMACLFQPNAANPSNAGGFDAVEKNNKIIFFTGTFTGPGVVDNKFDIYDITTNTWSIGVLPVDIYGASIISVNNTIYVAGGYVNGILSNQVWKLEF